MLIVDGNEYQCWKIKFLSCYKVSYETDANNRKIDNVKDMKMSQLGYFGQEIKVSEGYKKGFYNIIY